MGGYCCVGSRSIDGVSPPAAPPVVVVLYASFFRDVVENDPPPTTAGSGGYGGVGVGTRAAAQGAASSLAFGAILQDRALALEDRTAVALMYLPTAQLKVDESCFFCFDVARVVSWGHMAASRGWRCWPWSCGVGDVFGVVACVAQSLEIFSRADDVIILPSDQLAPSETSFVASFGAFIQAERTKIFEENYS